MTTGQLGEFLRARRGRLHPEDVGLSRYGERRRVAGLRREEVAQLAGVSVSYYTRLEQGQSANASEAILEALARALQLDVHEQAHLRELASRRAQPPRRPPVEHVSALTRDLLRSLDHLPVLVLGRRTDVLAWNELGHALLAGHVDFTSVDNPATRPNLARLLFLDPHTRDLYVDWHRKVRTVVGSLRLAAGRHPDDALLSALIGELSVKSEEFVSLWADHRVKPCEADSYDLRHPLAGPLTVTMQNLTLARDAEQSLVVVTTAEGSSSADALQLLARESRGKNIQDPMTAGRA
ncbi:helix-turn-helix domain-containing protein [Mycolicibacterium septicum]|nr:helix-turn-helix domain-containing protein [Mycolicibacterium septicum]